MPQPTLISTIQTSNPWPQVNNMGIGVATLALPSAFTTLSGDLLVALLGMASENSISVSASDSLNGAHTQRANGIGANQCLFHISSAASATGSATVSLVRSNTTSTNLGGMAAFQFRDHGGVGNVFPCTDAVQSGSIACSANSALLVLATSWAATVGARSWDTINGNAPTSTGGVDGDASTWGVAWAYYENVGAAGSKAFALLTPTYSDRRIAAIEILAGPDATTLAWVVG